MTMGRQLQPTRDGGVTDRSISAQRRAVLLLAILLTPFCASAATYTFIVAGLGGEPEYEQRFRDQADEIAAIAAKLAQAPEHVIKLSGADVSRDAIRKELDGLVKRAKESDAVTVVLIGHGTFDGEEYRFNVPGPDITGSELQRLLGQLRAREQLIVNTTSASGATVDKWTHPGRVVITATKSGGERTATRFARYWAEALKSGQADANKDEVVTASEAFEYASRQVAAAFKADVALATEHPRLEGDTLAQQFAVARLGSDAIITTDPEVKALLAQRTSLEQDLAAIKAERESLGDDAYYDALEGVLVKFALLQREIDARQPSQVSP